MSPHTLQEKFGRVTSLDPCLKTKQEANLVGGQTGLCKGLLLGCAVVNAGTVLQKHNPPENQPGLTMGKVPESIHIMKRCQRALQPECLRRSLAACPGWGHARSRRV